MSQLVIRPSAIIQYWGCGEAYRLMTTLRISSIGTSHALAFGTAGHKSALPFVAAHAQGETVDTVALFEAAWQEQLDNKVLRFSSRDAKDLLDIGKKLAAQFPDAWNATGLKAVTTPTGVLVENRLRLKLPDDVILSGEPDIVATKADDPDGDLVIPDLKFPSGAAFDGFAIASEQLTAYQTLLQFNLDRFGLKGRRIGQVGFIEGIKKKGAAWAKMQLADARTDEQMGEYASKVSLTAALIRKGHFPKQSGSAYNSPCATCDVANLCLRKDSTGLTSPLGSVSELIVAKPTSLAA